MRRYVAGGTMSGLHATNWDCVCTQEDSLFGHCFAESCECTCSNGQTYGPSSAVGDCWDHDDDHHCRSQCQSYCAGLTGYTPQRHMSGDRMSKNMRAQRNYRRGGRSYRYGGTAGGNGPCSGLDGYGNNVCK